jgi:hypothetical protein
MAGIHTPKSRCTIQNVAAISGDVMHILGTNEHPRRFLELPICGEWHPECIKAVILLGSLHVHGVSQFQIFALGQKKPADQLKGRLLCGN